MSEDKLINKKRDRNIDSVENVTKSDFKKQDTRKYLEKILVESEKKMSKSKDKQIDRPYINYYENKSLDKNLATLTSDTEVKKTKNIAERKMRMDEQGRVLDEKGNIIQIKPESKSTLKININKEKEHKVKELLKTQKIDLNLAKNSTKNFYDSNLDLIKKRRDKMRMHAFNFAEQGTFTKNLEELRKRQNAKHLGIDLNKTELTAEEEKDLINLDLLHIRPNFSRQPLKLKACDLIPDVEWWDSYFLPQDKISFSPYWIKDANDNWIHNVPEEIKFEDFKINENSYIGHKVTHYIQHPMPLKNEVIEKLNKVTLPVYLTPKEKKKLKRLRRLEKEKEKQELLKLGLIKPDPPKLKFNNFMRILGDQAIQDPSHVEKLVRKAYEERYAKMIKENQSKMLTKEQKADKIKRKFERDSKKEVRGCLFKIENLTSKKNRFKIDRNSQQLYLTGICIMMKKKNPEKFPNLLYVEGGPLAIKKFKSLILKRIQWNESSNDQKLHQMDIEENYETHKDNDQEVDNENVQFKIQPECLLIWEGNLKKRYYEKWKMIEVKSENDAKKILMEKGIDHFWNLIVSYKHDSNI